MKELSNGMNLIIDETGNGTEVKLTSRDVNDFAGTLKSIESVIALDSTYKDKTVGEIAAMKEATKALVCFFKFNGCRYYKLNDDTN